MTGGLSWDELSTICAGPYAARHAEACARTLTTATGTRGRPGGSCACSANSPTADPHCTWQVSRWPIVCETAKIAGDSASELPGLRTVSRWALRYDDDHSR